MSTTTIVGSKRGWTRPPTQEEALLAQRTNAVADVLRALRGAGSGLAALPGALQRAFKLRAWEEFQTPLGALTRQATFIAWVKADPPFGLGATCDYLRDLIDEDIELLAIFDQETRGGHGGDRRSKAIKMDNIHLEKAPTPGGTSRQAALRRLRKAADAGDERALQLLQDVIAGRISPHRAAVEMGWRKKPSPYDQALRLLQKLTQDELIKLGCEIEVVLRRTS
jgi:hypothetical protein